MLQSTWSLLNPNPAIPVYTQLARHCAARGPAVANIKVRCSAWQWASIGTLYYIVRRRPLPNVHYMHSGILDQAK